MSNLPTAALESVCKVPKEAFLPTALDSGRPPITVSTRYGANVKYVAGIVQYNIATGWDGFYSGGSWPAANDVFNVRVFSTRTDSWTADAPYTGDYCCAVFSVSPYGVRSSSGYASPSLDSGTFTVSYIPSDPSPWLEGGFELTSWFAQELMYATADGSSYVFPSQTSASGVVSYDFTNGGGVSRTSTLSSEIDIATRVATAKTDWLARTIVWDSDINWCQGYYEASYPQDDATPSFDGSLTTGALWSGLSVYIPPNAHAMAGVAMACNSHTFSNLFYRQAAKCADADGDQYFWIGRYRITGGMYGEATTKHVDFVSEGVLPKGRYIGQSVDVNTGLGDVEIDVPATVVNDRLSGELITADFYFAVIGQTPLEWAAANSLTVTGYP